MKKIIPFLSLLVPIICFSQEKLNELLPPTSPASSIINLNPTEILNPKNYQSLETAIFSNFSNEDNSAFIPDDFALEFSPYWFTNPSFSLENYLYPSFSEQFLRSSSISLASTQNFNIGEEKTNSIGFGYRTTLFFPFKSDKEKINNFLNQYRALAILKGDIISNITPRLMQNDQDLKKDIKQIIKTKILNSELLDNQIANNKIKLINNKIDQYDFKNKETQENLQMIVTTLDDILETKLKYENYKIYLKNRDALYIDLVYATFLNFPNNKFEFSYLPKQAIWLTPRLNLLDNLNALGVLRYEWYNLDYYNRYFNENNVYENNFDVGLAIDANIQRFNFKLELVKRYSNTRVFLNEDLEGNKIYQQSNNDDFQYIGSLSYKLTDQIILTYNLGKQFTPVINSENTLISLLALNFGFGGPTAENIK